jgi:hypothetical protein
VGTLLEVLLCVLLLLLLLLMAVIDYEIVIASAM